MTLTSFFQEIFRTFLYRVSLDKRTLLTIHDPGLRLLASEAVEKRKNQDFVNLSLIPWDLKIIF